MFHKMQEAIVAPLLSDICIVLKVFGSLNRFEK